jgi:hypothetical protein
LFRSTKESGLSQKGEKEEIQEVKAPKKTAGKLAGKHCRK